MEQRSNPSYAGYLVDTENMISVTRDRLNEAVKIACKVDHKKQADMIMHLQRQLDNASVWILQILVSLNDDNKNIQDPSKTPIGYAWKEDEESTAKELALIVNS